MATVPQTLNWKKSDAGGQGRALLLVHGIGNAKPGDYDFLLPKLEAVLAPNWGEFTVYTLYYDAFNDMINEKTQLGALLQSLLGKLHEGFGGSELGKVAAEMGGDVIWPVLSLSARQAIRAAYLAQLQQIVLDGIRAGFPAYRQKLSIICHSLGCFHTYEALHAAANEKDQHLSPAADRVTFQNVVFMASPAQMIRSVAGALGPLVPGGLAVSGGAGLSCPSALTLTNQRRYSVGNWVSIAGALDPVGGHLFRRKLDWAYMQVAAALPGFAGQVSRIDPQDWLAVTDEDELRSILWTALQTRQAGGVPARNPHSWEDYITRNAQELKGWLTA